MQAELVALWIAQHMGDRAAIAVGGDQLGAERGQPSNLGVLGFWFDMDVDVHPVLRDLALRHPLKEEPRLDPARVTARGNVPEGSAATDGDALLGRHPTGGNHVGHQLGMVLDPKAQHRRPERRLARLTGR